MTLVAFPMNTRILVCHLDAPFEQYGLFTVIVRLDFRDIDCGLTPSEPLAVIVACANGTIFKLVKDSPQAPGTRPEGRL